MWGLAVTERWGGIHTQAQRFDSFMTSKAVDLQQCWLLLYVHESQNGQLTLNMQQSRTPRGDLLGPVSAPPYPKEHIPVPVV